MKRRQTVITIGLVVAGAAATFALGRSRRPRPSGAVTGAHPASLDPAADGAGAFDREAAHRLGQASARLAAPPAPESSGAAGATPDRSAQAGRTVQALLARVHEKAPPGADAEDSANASRAFLMGWVDGLRHTSPGLLYSLPYQLRDRICSGPLSDVDAVVLGQLLQYVPEAATPEAFECFFTQFPNDGTPRWTMVDAWGLSGLATVPALEHIAAADPEALRRVQLPDIGPEQQP